MAFGIYEAHSKDWLAFLLGLFTMIKVRLLGTFGVSEIIMLYLLIFKVRENPFFLNRNAKILFILAILWAIGTILTDLIRGSSDVDLIKGFTSVVFLMLILPVTYWCIYDDIDRILYYIFGLSISSIIGFIFQQSINLDDVGLDVWQVYAYEYLAVFVAAMMFYRGRRLGGYAVLIGYGFWSLFHLSRNVFILFVVSSVLIYFFEYYFMRNDNPEEAQFSFDRNIVKTLIVLSLAFGGIKYSYEYLASNGTLGERAKDKYEMQKNSSMGLASGRGDFFITSKMIMDSPLVGYGSYAKDKHELAYQKAKELGIKSDSEYIQNKIRNKFIPGHSYILGAWVYNGILGLPFWIFSLYLIFKFFQKGLYSDPNISPLMIIWSMLMFWNILFSPFANRPIIAMFLSAILLILFKDDSKTCDTKMIKKEYYV